MKSSDSFAMGVRRGVSVLYSRYRSWQVLGHYGGRFGDPSTFAGESIDFWDDALGGRSVGISVPGMDSVCGIDYAGQHRLTTLVNIGSVCGVD